MDGFAARKLVAMTTRPGQYPKTFQVLMWMDLSAGALPATGIRQAERWQTVELRAVGELGMS